MAHATTPVTPVNMRLFRFAALHRPRRGRAGQRPQQVNGFLIPSLNGISFLCRVNFLSVTPRQPVVRSPSARLSFLFCMSNVAAAFSFVPRPPSSVAVAGLSQPDCVSSRVINCFVELLHRRERATIILQGATNDTRNHT